MFSASLNSALSVLTRGITIIVNGGGILSVIGVELDAVLARNPRPFCAKKTPCEPRLMLHSHSAFVEVSVHVNGAVSVHGFLQVTQMNETNLQCVNIPFH